MKLRPADFALAAVCAFCAFWWAYLYADSPTPEPTRDTAPAPWTPASSSPAIETDVAPGAPTSEEAP